MNLKEHFPKRSAMMDILPRMTKEIQDDLRTYSCWCGCNKVHSMGKYYYRKLPTVDLSKLK